MSAEPQKSEYSTDRKVWPVVSCEPTGTFLGTIAYDCTPDLTEEQKSWPVVSCESTDVFLGPALVLELTIRDDATPPDIVYGTAELLRALDARETELGGSGLVLDTRRHPAPKGKVRLVLYPKTEAGSKDRLSQLADLIAEVENPHPVIPSTVVGALGSFVECHAVAKI